MGSGWWGGGGSEVTVCHESTVKLVTSFLSL